MFPRRFSVPVALALCCLGGGIVWSRRAAPSTPKIVSRSFFPTRELEELDRVVQGRFAVIPTDGSFGYNRIAPHQAQELHGHFYATSKREKSAVAALRRANQQVAFYLVGRKKFVGRRSTAERLQGPVIVTTPPWTTEAEFQKVEAQYKKFSAIAPSKSQLYSLGDSVFAQAKPNDGLQARVNEWHIVARPIEASSERCVTCHNAMARKAAESAKPPVEQPDIVALHDPLGIALYCVRTAPKGTAQQQQRSR